MTSQNTPIIIFDTTLRDGDQAPGYALKFDEKIKMAKALASMGVDVIEAGFPISSNLDFRAVKAIAETVHGPRIAALARAGAKDIDRAAAALINCARPRIHTFIATSDDHMANKLGMTSDQVLGKIESSVRRASQAMMGRGDVEWSAEDASRTSPDFLVKAVRVAIEAGATTINLPDTVGYAMPDEYAAMFRHVMAEVAPGPEIIFSAHTHDDLGNAVANSIAALHAGARQVECTIKGIGERAGNAQMEAVIANLAVRGDRNPFTFGVNKGYFKPVADMHTGFVGHAPSNLPVVGDTPFAHGSGIHQDGMIKNNCYEIMDPAAFGHQESQYPLTRHSGNAGIKDTLEKSGISMNQDQLTAFGDIFKEHAAHLLESRTMRIVPPERTVAWARQFLGQRRLVA